MGRSGSSSNLSHEDVRSVFERSDEPSTPLTTAEIAGKLDRRERSVRDALEDFAERGAVRTRRIHGSTRIWWPSGAEPSAERSEAEEFSAFVSAVRDYAIFTLDADGTVVSWNDGAERIKGYREEEIVGRHFSTFYTEGDVEENVPQSNLEAAASEGRVEDEGWRVRKDGSRFWADVIITAVRDDDGTLQGFTKVTRDMTERREYEQQLRRERDLIEQIFETTPISIGVLDAEGHVVRANPRMMERHGVDEADLPAFSVGSLDAYDADGEPIPSEERPLMRALETGAPVYDFECRIEPSDGNEDDDQWLSINAAPLDDDSGDDDRVVVAIEEITERKARERELRRERDQTEQLLRTAPIAIGVQDEDGETILANERAEEAFGLSERLGEERADADEWVIYGADGERLSPEETPSARALATGEPVLNEELSVDPPEGDRRQFLVNASPILDADGAVERVVTTGEDVTELKEREQQLQRRKTELETELSEIFGRISDAFFALDDEWRFTHANARAAELMDRTGEELLDREFRDVFPGESEVYRERFRAAMETQEPVTFEVYAEVLGAWLEFNVYPSESGLSIYFRDVSERVERERTLTKYETIVETVNDGIYVKDEDGYFTMVNEAYAELTGYDRSELVGAHASLVVDEATIQQARAVKDGAFDDEGANPTMEAAIERADGEYVPTEGTFATIEADSDGQEQVGVVRDVSDRKEYERRIEESERRYRTLVENFPDGIVALFDSDLRYVAAGGELTGSFGIGDEGGVGETIYQRHPEDVLAQVEPHFRAALDGEANSFEVESAGRYFRAQTLPVKTTGDDQMGMFVVQDITERREYQRRLEESNERLEQFAYAASHDLQEPLRMVSSYLQLLERRYGEELDGDGEEFIEFAVDGADRMRRMIDALLEYSRVETQGDPFESVELDGILSDARENLQLQIEESGAAITAEGLPRVAGDPDQLRQLFQNLLENAIEYSGDDPPRIRVSAAREGDRWEVAVADEGIGIAPEDQERIFEVFQRLHSREEHSGTGIGLALCRRIVERHGGEIRVDAAPGEGTTVRFTLPAAGETGA